MKYAMSIIFVAIVALGAMAQPKYTHPSYSSSNYKMPYNAKKAKELNLDKNKNYEYNESKSTGMQSSANYKNSFAKPEESGALVPVLPVETDNFPMSGNYKMQFKGTRKSKKAPVEETQQEPLVIRPNED